MTVEWGWLIVGMAILVVGADLLVRGAVGLATAMRISPLVIGLTVVAFGTSTPEMAVSVVSSLRGEAGIALGNVIGSNIFNVLFVLGASAVIVPLVVSSQLVRFDVPLMIAASLVALAMAWDGQVTRIEGACLFLSLIVYTAVLAVLGRREANLAAALEDAPESAAPVSVAGTAGLLALLLVGLAMLVVGAGWMVEASSSIARAMGISELVIGVTIVAVGTSLPEVATSLMAAAKGERDLAVGNVVGSNVFNLLGVLGVSAAVSTSGLPVVAEALRLDMPLMVVVAAVCWPIVRTKHVVTRWEGAAMLLGYVAYTGFLIWQMRS